MQVMVGIYYYLEERSETILSGQGLELEERKVSQALLNVALVVVHPVHHAQAESELLA
jgi:hypothetical protein